ncbi:hypothetical protein SAMN05216358_3687 [Rhizobium sp. AN5]|uniref:hypothetical protein n=1 Tax=Rhizobium sp. AN5 TaxID=1855304 RepID=UPI000BCEA698|nr:hypothetical protein [Rhizobium sp. AN5]SOC93509.1 hypothetical protein SAMN05216358_3687 [Rhizobium sp. AN5]
MKSSKWVRRTSRGFEPAARQLLDGWIEATTKYCGAMDGREAPFFFNERANISMLAAASWLKGGIALEEYTASKFAEDRNSNGRCDLYVFLAGENIEFEAKSVKRRLPLNAASLSLHLRSKLDEAIEDARKLPPQRSFRRAACAFYTLRVEASRFSSSEQLKEKYAEELDRYKDALIAYEKCSAVAWCVPRSIERLRVSPDADEFVFGCIVALSFLT